MKQLLIIFFSVILLSGKISAQNYPNERIHELIQKGINALTEENFSEAKLSFEKIKAEFPANPIGDIYLAATEISLSYDFGFPYRQEYIIARLESAQNLFQNENLRMPEVWKNYFWATLKTYKAYYFYLTDDWIGALTTGLSALSYLEDCIELDKNFHEAKMGLGIYKYWKSKKTEWIPFFSNEMEEGIALIKEASEKMSYNKALALHSLFWIYLEEKKYSSATQVAAKGVELYPNSSYAFFMYGRSMEASEKKKALTAFSKSLELLQTKTIKSNYRTIFIKYKLAELNNALGNRSEMKKYCSEILAVKNLTDHEKKLLKNVLLKVNNLNKL